MTTYILGIKFRDYGQIQFYTLPGIHVDRPEEGEGAPDSDPVAAPAAEKEMTCGDPCPVHAGDMVIAENEQGAGLGLVVHVGQKIPAEMEGQTIPSIVRIASEQDREAIEDNRSVTKEAFQFCASRIRARRLDMKLVDVEVLFDRSKIIFYFTAPTRIDFRELVKDLVREYHVRIELRQIGVRHETQMVGAVGNCGMVCCCRRFLRKFAPVTIKMAKEQNLFLNPSKISGICGRLLCCLSYEQENYDAFHRECPKLGKRYHTSRGNMRVLRVNMFRNSVIVLTDAKEELEFDLDEWQKLHPSRPEVPPQPQNAVAPAQNRPQSSEMIVVTADPDSFSDGDDSRDEVIPPAAGHAGEDVPAADAGEGGQDGRTGMIGAGRARRRHRRNTEH